jgi:hypothetical protein
VHTRATISEIDQAVGVIVLMIVVDVRMRMIVLVVVIVVGVRMGIIRSAMCAAGLF